MQTIATIFACGGTVGIYLGALLCGVKFRRALEHRVHSWTSPETGKDFHECSLVMVNDKQYLVKVLEIEEFGFKR